MTTDTTIDLEDLDREPTSESCGGHVRCLYGENGDEPRDNWIRVYRGSSGFYLREEDDSMDGDWVGGRYATLAEAMADGNAIAEALTEALPGEDAEAMALRLQDDEEEDDDDLDRECDEWPWFEYSDE